MGRAQLRWNTGCGIASPPAAFTPPLAAGIRASPSNVGYFPAYGALTVYNPGGAAPTGWAWDVNTLVTTTANAVLNLAQVNGGVVAGHADPTITKCKVIAPAGEIFCVSLNGTGKGTLTVADCTIVGTSSGATYQVNGISSDSNLDARRCDVSGSGDGIHLNAGGALVSQNYIHDLASVDAGQHLDGIQQFNTPVGGAFTVEHCYVDTPDSGPAGVSSSITTGTEVDTDPLVNGTINNNWFGHGAFSMRLNHRMQNMIVTNNDFEANVSGEFGLISVFDPASVITWTNNRDSGGNLIPPP